jgi:TolB-like protein/DNA-binding winged helix-turn-helix (wHTH) protein/Tfp pilus assembly protein PilF
MSPGNGNIYEFGDFRLIPDEGLLLRHGKPVPLTLKAFATLTLLVDRHGHLVSKSELLETVWEGSFVEEGAVSRSVHTIRNALGEGPKSNRFIETVPRRGYRFVAPVRSVVDHPGAFTLAGRNGADPHEAEIVSLNGGGEFNVGVRDPKSLRLNGTDQDPVTPSELSGSAEFDETPLGWSDRSPFLTRLLIALAAGTLIVGGLAFGVYFYRKAQNPSPRIQSLGVMPFSNLTGQENDAYIVDGITEHLINSLSRIPSLYVAAPASSFVARDRSLDPREASRELKVGHQLSGSVQRDGEFLRVSLRMIEGATGKVVWTRDAFRPAAEIFALQDDVARLSAEAITGNPAAAELIGDYGTADREAYLHYLKGRYLWNRQTELDLTKAISEFEKAVARDPNFALAYCGLSDVYTALAFYFHPPNESMPKAESYAARALSIEPDLPDALFSDASVKFWYRRDFVGARRSVLRALEIRPNHALAHNLYGDILISEGQVDEGLAKIRHSVQLDPLAHFQACDLAWQQFNGGRYDEAAVTARTNVETFPSCPFDRLFLAQSLYMTERPGEAMSAIEEIESVSAGWVPGVAERAHMFAASGKKQDAERLLRDLQTISGQQYVDPYAFAVVSAGLKDADSAFSWLNKAVDANSYNLVFLDRDPRFLSIRKDRRFEEVLRRSGLLVLSGPTQ